MTNLNITTNNDSNTLRQATRDSAYNHIYLTDLYASLYIIFSLAGVTSDKSLYIAFFLYLIWLGSAAVSNPKLMTTAFMERKQICLFFYLVFIGFIGPIVASFSYTIKQIFSGMLLFSPIFIFNFYSQVTDSRRIHKLFSISILAWLLLCLNLLKLYSEHSNAARTMARNREAFGVIISGGAYAFAYGSAILSVILLDLLLGKKLNTKRGKTFALLIFVLLSTIVFQTHSTITLISWAIGCLACIVFRPKLRQYESGIFPALRSFSVFLILAILLVFGLPVIGEWLIDHTKYEDNIIFKRLNSVGYRLAYGESSDQSQVFEDRASLPLKSVATFLDNPVIGVSYRHGNGYRSPSSFGIGRHGEWADALGNHGVIGGLPFLLIFIFLIDDVRKLSCRRLSCAWWVTLLMLGAFNPFQVFQPLFASFFLVPFVALQVGKENNCASL